MRKLFSIVGSFGVMAALVTPAFSDDAWPTRPVQIIVPFAPGSLTDVAARAIAQQLGEQTKQSFVIDNRGGAGGTIGTAAVAKAEPDGYTFVFTDSSFMISAALYPKLPYDPLKDFEPVMLAVEAPAVMIVRPGLPVSSVGDFVALAKTKPGEMDFGSGGVGSSGHLSTELFMSQTGTKITHVPFKGVGAALTEILADRLDLAIPSFGATAGHIRNGTVKALAVTGKERVPAFPDIPTFAQAGYPDFDVSFRFGFLAPTGTPPAIIANLQEQVSKAMEQPKVQEFLVSQGAIAIDVRSNAYREAIIREIGVWKGVIDKAGVKVE